MALRKIISKNVKNVTKKFESDCKPKRFDKHCDRSSLSNMPSSHATDSRQTIFADSINSLEMFIIDSIADQHIVLFKLDILDIANNPTFADFIPQNEGPVKTLSRDTMIQWVR